MLRLGILAIVGLLLGGCNLSTVYRWELQEHHKHQITRCQTNPASDPQLCAQIAPEATKS